MIYAAYRRCGQLRPGALNSPDLLADAMAEFGFLFDSWNAQRTMQYTLPDYVYPVTQQGSAAIESGQVLGLGFFVGPSISFTGTTTIGSNLIGGLEGLNIGLQLGMKIAGTGIPTGTYVTKISDSSVAISQNATASGQATFATLPDFQGPRPSAIVRANLVYTVTPGAPTRIPLSPISASEWANISVLQLTPINVTTVYYYEPASPCGILWCWPPLNGNSIELFTWGFLTPPATPDTQMLLPTGYQDAMVFTLAERLWPLCTIQIAAQRVSLLNLRGDAYRARESVRRINAPMPRLRNDFGTGGGGHQTPACDWTLLLAGVPY